MQRPLAAKASEAVSRETSWASGSAAEQLHTMSGISTKH